MPDFQISFTLDTICPWTYLAKKRLDEALETFRKNEAYKDVKFIVKFFPYQLYPDFSQEGEDRYEWYKRTKYDNDSTRMQRYTEAMNELGGAVGIQFDFTGDIANTFDAHRTIQYWQEKRGPEAANDMVDSLYKLYFTTGKRYHPSHKDTLLTACLQSGFPPGEMQTFLADPSLFVTETKALIREQRSNGIDSVPTIVVEGRKRDFTLVGAKEVKEYVKVLESVAKESR